ncbi:alpha/beta hydrolase [Embleya sp. NBC_00896]|uniref:alpha/beta hydrolase n=1 Tax=Embleya sp. NBC_00896 TaxID=2975961 RepID=UPI0038642AC2|nr:esterase family protein [Embleya sp. NBC_00896]
MSLTGTPFYITTIVLAIAALIVAMVAWNHIPGPKPIKIFVRLFMLVTCQVTAILMVFVMVNNANSLYDTWDDFLGTGGGHVTEARDPAPPPAPEQKLLTQFKSAPDGKMGDGVQETTLKGPQSAVEAEVYVWLPPQYKDPAYKDKKFPVVELLPGYPGSAKAWFGTLKVNEQLKSLMNKGEVAPFILVSPRTKLLGGNEDTGCADIPGKANADTWISGDVRRMVIDNFRAESDAKHWAIAGYSAGGHCAMRMALLHPDRYRAGVSLSGYNDPKGEPDSATSKDPALRVSANPLTILKNAPQPPHVSLYLAGEKGDGFGDAQEIRQNAKPPTSITVAQISGGGHGTDVWRNMVPDVFRWLTNEMR